MTDTHQVDAVIEPREPITKRDLVEQNVEKVIDKSKAISIAVASDLGGTGYSNMLEVIESAKMMAMAGPMVPKWLQGNPGGCWGIILQAIEWKFSPLSVAKMSFEVNGVVAYMSQLVHAVIEARAPLQGRLRCEFEGESATRLCIVTGLFKDDNHPQVYRSPKFGDINPKNSPLWKNDPDQQLWYFSSRAWCRRFAPDVLMGVYAKDEIIDNPSLIEGAIAGPEPDPSLHKRLQGTSRAEGHQPGHAEAELANVAAGGRGVPKPSTKAAKPAEKAPARPKRSERLAARRAAPKTPAKAETIEEKTATQNQAEIHHAAGTTAADGKPKSPSEYCLYAATWIDTAKPDGISSDDHAGNLEARWDGERDWRDELSVPMRRRKEIEEKLVVRCQTLRSTNH